MRIHQFLMAGGNFSQKTAKRIELSLMTAYTKFLSSKEMGALFLVSAYEATGKLAGLCIVLYVEQSGGNLVIANNCRTGSLENVSIAK